MGWFYGFNLHIVCNEMGEIVNFMFTPGNVYDREPLKVEHSRHRSFHNFVNNLMSGLAAYCFFPKKPMLQLEREIDNQLTIF